MSAVALDSRLPPENRGLLSYIRDEDHVALESDPPVPVPAAPSPSWPSPVVIDLPPPLVNLRAARVP
jgi:hypothetical protein